MSDRPNKRFPLLLAAAFVAAAGFFGACSCEEDVEGYWDLEDPVDEPEDDDWDWAFPDSDLDPDPTPWDETSWEAETIEEDMPRSFAYDDRTSVLVDYDGTLWLGYHRCSDAQCSNPELVVGHQHYDEDQWHWESIEAHTGLFGLEIVDPGSPIVVYLDATSADLKAATRQSDGRWLIERLPVDQVSGRDGFDISRDETRYYVSHASQSRGTIEFFTYNTASSVPYWRRLQPLSSARSAAYERGLRAGNDLNFYLVHRDSAHNYRLSEFDLEDDQWTRSTGEYPAAISSFLVRQNGQLCTVGPDGQDLLSTCGTFDDPLAETEQLHGRSVHYLSSLIEARDETLFVGYHDGPTGDLHVARRPDGQYWTTERAHRGDTSGISTTIDHRDHVVMSFYHCDESRCDLKVLRRTP